MNSQIESHPFKIDLRAISYYEKTNAAKNLKSHRRYIEKYGITSLGKCFELDAQHDER
ncbi:hypothetical protein VUJ46_14225 [Chryseobacterium sp. MYb264]|uniref:hypothetical protein n=1 Tax=Chryseobacterium sp. MYb264 TaxID=2745153 RepID=UPI002E0DDD33|nr:hypothetical protein VUJ46_14225 [Chryseobacterium sp. MYb264]